LKIPFTWKEAEQERKEEEIQAQIDEQKPDEK